jgi:hypothetical protein
LAIGGDDMAQERSTSDWETRRGVTDVRAEEEVSGWAIGWVLFAAVLLIMVGMFQGFQGFVAILRDNFYVAVPNYLINVDVTVWGWTHLVLGIIAVITGFALFRAALWARIVGIGFAVLSAVINFFFIPYYPFWSIMIIAMDTFVIWALAAHGKDVEYW